MKIFRLIVSFLVYIHIFTWLHWFCHKFQAPAPCISRLIRVDDRVFPFLFGPYVQSLCPDSDSVGRTWIFKVAAVDPLFNNGFPRLWDIFACHFIGHLHNIRGPIRDIHNIQRADDTGTDKEIIDRFSPLVVVNS